MVQRQQLEKSRNLLIRNLYATAKFGLFANLVMDWNTTIDLVVKALKSDEVFKEIEIKWEYVIPYKDIYINLDAVMTIVKHFARTDLLDGKRVHVAIKGIEIPSNPVNDHILKYFALYMETKLLNRNIVYFDFETMLEKYYSFYAKLSKQDKERRSVVFRMLFPTHQEQSTHAFYEESMINHDESEHVISDYSSVNSFKLFYKR